MRKLLFVILPYYFTLAQPFQISAVPTEEYSTDHFENTIYYLDRYTWEVYKTDLDDGITKKSDLPFLPSFANKSHKAVYHFIASEDKNVYLYDFDLDTTYVLIKGSSTSMLYKQSSYYSSLLIFSPDDSKLLIKGYPTSAYFSFEDSTIYDLGIDLFNTHNVEWSSDTSLIYQGFADDNFILSININQTKVDTILKVDRQYAVISSFSYNNLHNEIAYSLYELPPKIYLYKSDTKEQKIIFDPPIDDPDSYAVCWSSYVAFNSLKWSLNQKELAFFSFMGTVSGSGIYTYNKDSLKTYRYTLCDDYGLKYYMDWLNNDTIIYLNLTEYTVFGLNVSEKIVGVKEQLEQNKNGIQVNIYPNPFNSTTTISYTLPYESAVDIIIYDVMGREIRTFNTIQTAGTQSIYWDGLNSSGEGISSGIYFYRLKLKSLDTRDVFETTSKLMMVK